MRSVSGNGVSGGDDQLERLRYLVLLDAIGTLA